MLDFNQISAFFAIIIGVAGLLDATQASRGGSFLARKLLGGPTTVKDAISRSISSTDATFIRILGAGGFWSRVWRIALLSCTTFVLFYIVAIFSIKDSGADSNFIDIFSENGPHLGWFFTFLIVNILADITSFHQTRMIYQTLNQASKDSSIGAIRLCLFIVTDIVMSFAISVIILSIFFGLSSFLFSKFSDIEVRTIYAFEAQYDDSVDDRVTIWYLSPLKSAKIRNNLSSFTFSLNEPASEEDSGYSYSSRQSTNPDDWDNVAFSVLLNSALQYETDELFELLKQTSFLCDVTRESTAAVRPAQFDYRFCYHNENSIMTQIRFALGKIVSESGTSIQTGFSHYVSFSPLRQTLGVPSSGAVGFGFPSGVEIQNAQEILDYETRIRQIENEDSEVYSFQPVGTYILTSFCTSIISLALILVFLSSTYVNTVRKLLIELDGKVLSVSRATLTISATILYISIVAILSVLSFLFS